MWNDVSPKKNVHVSKSKLITIGYSPKQMAIPKKKLLKLPNTTSPGSEGWVSSKCFLGQTGIRFDIQNKLAARTCIILLP